MNDRYSIHVASEPRNGRLEALLAILEDVMPMRWSSSPNSEQEKFDAQILPLSGSDVSKEGAPARPSLTLPLSDGAEQLSTIEVRFFTTPLVPFPWRGRTVLTSVGRSPVILAPRPREDVLASTDKGPIWTVLKEGNSFQYRSGLAMPELTSEGRLLDVMNGRRFLEILPLIHWLRQIEEATLGYSVPERPIRASFIFDDPNLHWPQYGYVDYGQMAASAQAHDYHVSFAAIPLDAWFTHRPTAAIFQAHKDRLSLAIHGNNHTSRELAQPNATNVDRVFLLKEALARIQRLERQSGLSVSRVMVPPHGACSEEMLVALPTCTFQAICLSHSGLCAHNKGKAWTKSVGYLPFELIHGCPDLPRWPMSAPEYENMALLAIYLKQAPIFYGHHGDLKNGLGILEKIADFINSLGRPVQWSDLGAIALAASQDKAMRWTRQLGTQGSTLKPFSCPEANRVIGRTTFKQKAAPLIRRMLTEGRDRLKLGVQ
jgi:hypothetical protein